MLHTLAVHKNKLILIFGLALLSLLASIGVSEPKHWQEIDWLDVLGEGGSAMALAVWVILVLGSRPAGRVTDLLTLGLGFMFIAMWQDNLDEFLRIPAEQWWDHWLESGAMPIGIAMLTYGLFHWHSEQLAINRQLEKREQLFREHRFIDGLTQLGRIDYLRQQLERQLQTQPQAPISVVMAGIEYYPDIVRQLGHRNADRLLREVAEVITLNLRRQDVICRYAGDRFALVLPDTNAQRALNIALEVSRAVANFAFKSDSGDSHYQRLLTGVYTSHQNEGAEQIILSANQAMEKAGEHNGCFQVA